MVLQATTWIAIRVYIAVSLAYHAARFVADRPYLAVAAGGALGAGISGDLAPAAAAAAVVYIAATSLPIWADQLRTARCLRELRAKFAHCDFVEVPVSELQCPELCAGLPTTARFSKRYLTLWYLQRAAGASRSLPLLGGFKAYQLIGVRAHIFCPDHPNRLSPLQLFQLLHEFGHAGLVNAYFLLPASAARPLAMAALLLATTAWTPASVGLWIVILLLEFIVHRCKWHERSTHVLRDEMLADHFAMTRCNPAWFQQRDTDRLAALLAKSDRGCMSYRHQGWLPVIRRDDQRQRRLEALKAGLRNVASGAEIDPPSITISFSPWPDRMIGWLGIASTGLMAYACFAHWALTPFSLVLLSALAAILAAVGVACLARAYVSHEVAHQMLSSPGQPYVRPDAEATSATAA